jgi:hypothetical protein
MEEHSCGLRIFERKREELIGLRGELHNEELCDLYASPNITRVIKSRRIKRAEHLGCMEMMVNAYNISLVIPVRKRQVGRKGVNWRIILTSLKLIFKNL